MATYEQLTSSGNNINKGLGSSTTSPFARLIVRNQQIGLTIISKIVGYKRWNGQWNKSFNFVYDKILRHMA